MKFRLILALLLGVIAAIIMHSLLIGTLTSIAAIAFSPDLFKTFGDSD